MMMMTMMRNLLLDTGQYVWHLVLWPNLMLIVPGARVLKEIIKRTMAIEIGFLLRYQQNLFLLLAQGQD